jgi:prolyl oligopeptidase
MRTAADIRAELGQMGYRYYFYEVKKGGHGAGANVKERSFTTALELTYFTRKLY